MTDHLTSKTALVLFSGGQDSTTCLAWALDRFAHVEMLGFNYGQRHAIELDCRDQTVKALQTALSLGMDTEFELHTPLMWLDKAATWKLANELGGAGLVDLIREHSHTCYLGERGARHEWGYGCGECPACSLRAKGWREYAGTPSQL